MGKSIPKNDSLRKLSRIYDSVYSDVFNQLVGMLIPDDEAKKMMGLMYVEVSNSISKNSSIMEVENLFHLVRAKYGVMQLDTIG